MSLWNKWFGKTAEVQPIDEPLKADEKGGDFPYFNTHAMRTRQQKKEIIETALLEPAPDFKVVDAQGVAMDGGGVSQAKTNFTLGQSRISDDLFCWYITQSFIGYQACGLISQHWLVDRACSLKGRDAVRNGYDIALDDGQDADPEMIKYIEKMDKRFKLKKHLEEADKFKNVHGIRHVLFLYDGVDYEKPFNPDGIRPGSYRGITQIDPYWVTEFLSREGVEDPTSQNFYYPEFWVISGKKYHHTHFVTLRGPEVPDILKPSYQYGGIPLVQRIYERVYAAERTANEAPLLAQSKRLNVRKMDLTKAVANQAAFEAALSAMAEFRDNYGVLAIGEDEEHHQLETTLTDLDVTIMTQYQIVAGISGIPSTKLMGTSPKGFQSTGEHEISAYHEELESIQENDLSPIVERHHICLMHSHVSKKFNVSRETEIDHVWRPLAVVSDEAMSQIQERKANTARTYLDIGAMDAYDVRDQIVKDEDSGFTGLEEVERPEPLEDLEPEEIAPEQEAENDDKTNENKEIA